MDITFISMHDLSQEARLVYASDSITDVLGYEPHEVVGHSLFAYFHPDEIPLAQTFHGRGVQMDKAAVLAYCKLLSKTGEYIYCECVFTVVYSVVVAATSVYRQTNRSHERALNAPYIRRAFSSSQRDPRYHMLAHLSPKFSTSQGGQHEPRACLILNRFTRQLTILYATNILLDILGFPPNQAVGMSFFEFISPGCLQDAVEALERAKENDSIAYLRFYARDPRGGEGVVQTPRPRRREQQNQPLGRRRRRNSTPVPVAGDHDDDEHDGFGDPDDGDSVMTSDGDGEDDDKEESDEEGDDDDEMENQNRADNGNHGYYSPPGRPRPPPVGPEVEAVVSCTSDGLVVVIRRARPMIPFSDPRPPQAAGFFASPWARPPYHPPQQMVGNELGGPAPADFMDSIRQVAVFAWCLRSINENMVQYAKFEPNGAESVLTQPRNQENHEGLDHDDSGEVDDSAYSGNESSYESSSSSNRRKARQVDGLQQGSDPANAAVHAPRDVADDGQEKGGLGRKKMQKRKRAD